MSAVGPAKGRGKGPPWPESVGPHEHPARRGTVQLPV